MIAKLYWRLAPLVWRNTGTQMLFNRFCACSSQPFSTSAVFAFMSMKCVLRAQFRCVCFVPCEMCALCVCSRRLLLGAAAAADAPRCQSSSLQAHGRFVSVRARLRARLRFQTHMYMRVASHPTTSTNTTYYIYVYMVCRRMCCLYGIRSARYNHTHVRIKCDGSLSAAALQTPHCARPVSLPSSSSSSTFCCRDDVVGGLVG